ncbi:unnamed protein product [Clonostachys rosea f. rosea IK726]|uniref:Uncharacterized protein n=1 Tax=Clonostachys rosea f. rosea IK726 TaxID=1349383 RepID=A0ACA9TZ67_BIOOC|nr:unnamed protein product [Clonostachys rosea f. rosea IK726]
MAAINIPTHVIPPTQGHSHTIVFLHGRGDNATNFSRSLYSWRDSQKRNLFEVYPSFKWVFPQAPPRPCASSPSTIMPQWFDVWNTKDFSDREELQAAGLREVVPAVRDIIKGEAALVGGDFRRVVLAGISMGAATSIHTLFNLDVPTGLGAFIGFSCRCPFAGRSLAEMREVLQVGGAPADNGFLQNTPVLLEHCADDPLVVVENGRKNRDILKSFGANVEWREYPSGGHWLHSPNGVDDIIIFLNYYLGGGGVGNSASANGDAMDMS